MTSFNRFAVPLTVGVALVAAGFVTVADAAAAPACSARSPAVAPPVVELYTSEGCSSCRPADTWLSRLQADPAVVALAFHVDSWDRLGWKDRFASPAFTRRQAEQQRASGARFSYTPQVIINGADRPDWPRATVAPGGGAATLQFELAGTADAAHPREVKLVIIDADSGRPVQAVKLGC